MATALIFILRQCLNDCALIWFLTFAYMATPLMWYFHLATLEDQGI